MNQEQIKVGDLIFEKWIDRIKIQDRIRAMADEIRPMYEGKDLVVLGVLNGAVFFTIALLRKLQIPYRLDFIQASSYSGTKSTGQVRVTPIKESLKDSHVLITEDIVDTGRTIEAIKSVVSGQEPASLRVASLFYKPEADIKGHPPEHIGFSIANHFILGFGLDYDGLGRELEDVYKVVDPKEQLVE